MLRSLPAESDPQDAVVAFEQAKQRLRRCRRRHEIAFIGLFGLALALSCYLGEVRVEQFVEGIPGVFNYVRDITPEIHAHSLLHDLGEWYWGIGTWL